MKVAGPLLLLASIVYFAALAPYGLNVDDEGTLLYQIYRVYSGQALYVDFHAGYTPGIFHWNAGLFWLFGPNVLWIRLCLALVNGVSVFLLYWLGRQLGSGRGAAAAGPLLYLAFIPFYDGQFGAFNIPYPIWYVTLFWLLGLVCAIRAWRGRAVWWLAAGLSAGAVFSFKPNSGLLCLAGLLIAMCLAPREDRDPEEERGGALRPVERFLRWAIPLFLVVGLTLFFLRGAGEGVRQVLLFALPLAAVTAAAAARVRRAEPPAGLLRDLALLGSGFALLILPWVTWYWSQLGARAFLRAILFVGTDFDRFYYLPYPRLGLWEAGLVAAFAALALTGLLIRRRVLPVGLVLAAGGVAGAIAVGWLWVNPPPMVEGFQQSVVSRLRHLAFGLMLMIEWAAVVVFVFRPATPPRQAAAEGQAPRRRPSRIPRRAPETFLLVVSAVLMHMQLYPRTDFMHLVPACPLVLVLGGWLLDRVTRLWAAASPLRVQRGGVRLALLAPVYALVLVLVAPALARIEYLARAAAGGGDALVHLDVPHAPLVLEPAAGRTFLGLSSLVRFLDANTAPDEHVFTFPALDLVCFLAERHNPTRHGYFYPGWPGREEEAEVIGELRARPPRWIVSLHDHALFFMAAPLYYFNLRQHVVEAYAPFARIGTFDVLVARDQSVAGIEADGALPAAETLWVQELEHSRGPRPRRLAAILESLPPGDSAALAQAVAALGAPSQRLFAALVRKSRSPAGAAAMARLLPDRSLDPTVRDLFVRAIAEVGNLTAAPFLLEAASDPDATIRVAAAGDLYAVLSRGWLEDFWWVPPEHPGIEDLRDQVSVPLLAQWIDDQWALYTLRSFAVHTAGRLRIADVAPFLVRVAASEAEMPGLRLDALYSLDRLGQAGPFLPLLGRLLQVDAFTAPALLARLYPQDPDLALEILQGAMQSFNPAERAAAFWVATAVRDPRLEETIQGAVHDPNQSVRKAARFATEFPDPDLAFE
jgi:hypothetical protein